MKLHMGLILAILLIVLLLGVGGFALHLLWIVAVVALVVWLLGFVARGPSGRWYRW